TTHYIEEAEDMADRIGIINSGKIIHVEETSQLMHTLGKKHIVFELTKPFNIIPDTLAPFHLKQDGNSLEYVYESKNESNHINTLLDIFKSENITIKDIYTKQSSLEEIFVEMLQPKMTEK
ncbi:MAG: multidrug ABC transporter ATP-binding protein, partial [Candidatus Margulisbacteria bacterium]|nr:multidrug ABC transporter ATP-binding protein [Candidatus Margulisiibacteriota bacterium]